MKRRDFLKYGLAAGGTGILGSKEAKAKEDLTKYLCSPDDQARDLDELPQSPPAEPYKAELFVPPIMQPFDESEMQPGPVPSAHQRYNDFKPQKFYQIFEQEFRWNYHPDPPYTVMKGGQSLGSYSWGFHSPRVKPTGLNAFEPHASTPGPTYFAKYDEPVLARIYNDLPTLGHARASFALPSTAIHLHNGHTASESDGNPQDWIDPGEFWDHHYGNFPLGHDPREKLTTLWYHDHRLDFTASNVYAGLAGFYLLFDNEDTGDENTGWQLPSFPHYDIPLIIQDVKFAHDPVADPAAQVVFENFNTDGMIGDRVTVNRRITPHFKVEPRKYRFRILNGGPSRFYQLFLRDPQKRRGTEHPHFVAITGDGNFLPEPIEAESLFLSVAQRVDVIMDFSGYKPGDHVYMHNLLKQINGAGPARGPSGPFLDFDDPATHLMRFDVIAPRSSTPDNSKIPDYFRPLPTINMSEVKRERTWLFDYDGGLWTINGKIMDPNRIDAGIDQDSAEIWNLVNGGNDWSHPIHSHFSEFLILEINGKPYRPTYIQTVTDGEMTLVEYLGRAEGNRPRVKAYLGGPRRDVATLLPGDEMKVFMRWADFLGKHVMHCHNVVHEDHAMMIRWDIMPPGRGFDEPRNAEEVYSEEHFQPGYPDPRPPSKPHLEERPHAQSFQEGK